MIRFAMLLYVASHLQHVPASAPNEKYWDLRNVHKLPYEHALPKMSDYELSEA